MTDAAEGQVETWKPVLGFEGFYSVSDMGRVMSHARWVPRKSRPMWINDRILKGASDKYGYVKVALYKDDKAHQRKVHVLVAEAFLGQRPPGYDCAHADGDPSNSRLGNLRWATRTENMRDAIAHGRSLRGERNPNTKTTEAQTRALLSDCRSAAELARHVDLTPQSIRRIRNGKSWAWLQNTEAAE